MKRTMLLALALSVSMAQADGGWLHESGEVEAIFQDGGNTILDETAKREVTPRLEFRCDHSGGEIIARIDWRRFISSFGTAVGFKVDGGAFTWLKWKVDSSEQVTVSPSADDTQKLIGILEGGESLLIDVTPYSEGPVTVTFDLAGFEEALGDLRERCR
ncbi:MAG: hypothetical protein OEW59_07540 [Gammaproteobacteria bacterium]|nr:hypothetical protein [Gammaproteobacteria bacterium]